MQIPAHWIDRLRYRHTSFELELVSGEHLAFRCPVGGEGRPGRSFVFALHKSGSVLLNGIVSDLSRAARVPNLNVPEILFRKGVKWKDVAAVPPSLFEREGVVFSGFRQMPQRPFVIDFRSGDRTALLVRDPRDILVSLYFSMKFSHSLPKSGGVRDRLVKIRETAGSMGIDEYVLDAASSLRRQFELYQDGLLGRRDVNVRVFRYEDVIFQKERWVDELSSHFAFDVSATMRKKISARYDFVPKEEDPTAHVRRVAPGDHVEKLATSTIATLDDYFRGAVEPFGYSL